MNESKTYNMRVYLRTPQGRFLRFRDPMTETEVGQFMTGLGNMMQGNINGALKDGRVAVIPMTNVSYIEFIER